MNPPSRASSSKALPPTQTQQQPHPLPHTTTTTAAADPNNNEPLNNNNKITPELLVDALSGHEDGLLSIAEKLMLSYDSGYDAMGESIIDAFADVQKLFQHVVEAAHMEGAALERERSEGEWRVRLQGMGLDLEDVMYGRSSGGEMGLGGMMMDHGGDHIMDGFADGGGGGGGGSSPLKGEIGNGGYNTSPLHHHHHHGDDHPNNGSSLNTPTTKQSAEQQQEHRHEELIDQDVRDVLIDAIRRGQAYREHHQFDDCRSLYEQACTNASSLLPVDSDHRGRLQLAIARAESMASDRAVAILKYAMDDVLRSGLSLRRGKYMQMNDSERGDCVLSRPNPLRNTASRGYDVPSSAPWGGGGSGGSNGGGGHANSYNHHSSSSSMGGDATVSSTVEQSAEEALNSLVEEMKEMLAAPIYNLTPLQSLSEKFWCAMGEAKKSSSKKEERLEQALAKIKADFLLAREEYEEQLTNEKERVDALKRRVNEMKLENNNSSRGYYNHDGQTISSQDVGGGGGDGLSVPYTPKRPPSSTSRSSGGSGTGNNSTSLLYHFGGMSGDNEHHQGSSNSINNKHSSSQSVVSLGSEFAQKAKSLVHLLNCQAGGNERNNNVLQVRTREEEEERLNYEQRRMRGGSPRL